VLKQLMGQARALGLPAAVLTFEPLPREYFQPDAAPARLSTFRAKFQLLAALGLDKLVSLRFQSSLANMPAVDFVQHLFVDAMDARRIIIGDDQDSA